MHQTCKPVIISVVSSNPTGGNFNFLDTSIVILYKNDRNVRFVLYTKTSSEKNITENLLLCEFNQFCFHLVDCANVWSADVPGGDGEDRLYVSLYDRGPWGREAYRHQWYEHHRGWRHHHLRQRQQENQGIVSLLSGSRKHQIDWRVRLRKTKLYSMKKKDPPPSPTRLQRDLNNLW